MAISSIITSSAAITTTVGVWQNVNPYLWQEENSCTPYLLHIDNDEE